MSEQYQRFELGKSEQIEHLGLVSVLFKNLDLETLTNQLLPIAYKHVSPGQRLLAMILNALGFVNRPLYLTPHFLNHLHLTRLIAPNVKAEFFNDDVLGRFLDQVYKFGPEEFFQTMSLHIFDRIDYSITALSLDSTSISTFARRPEPEDDEPIPSSILLRKGYSKDHRPDLNQLILNLVCTGAEGLPCAISILPGDTNDKKSFLDTIRKVTNSFKQKFSLKDTIWIGDAAMHSKKTLDLAKELNFQWIVRVPHTNFSVIKEIEQASKKTEKNWKTYELDHSYQFYETTLQLEKHQYRALVLKSQSLRELKLKTFEKRLKQKEKTVNQKVSFLEKKLFDCKEDGRCCI